MTDGTPVQKPKRLKGPSPQLAPLSTSSRVMEFVEPEEVVRQREAEEQNVSLPQQIPLPNFHRGRRGY